MEAFVGPTKKNLLTKKFMVFLEKIRFEGQSRYLLA